MEKTTQEKSSIKKVVTPKNSTGSKKPPMPRRKTQKDPSTMNRTEVDTWHVKMPKWLKTTLVALGFVLWVLACFFVVQLACSYVFTLLLTPEELTRPITNLIFAAVTYIAALAVIIIVPWKVLKMKTNREEMGLRGLPTWTDILLAPVGLIASLILAAILIMIFSAILPNVDWSQEQELGFNNLYSAGEMIQGFIALVVLAPIAEELIFRGWLYGKLRARIPMLPALMLCSILFGVLHGQWNVGLTTFAMSAMMCITRELTGTVWSGILLHMIKNGVAFYLLYVVMA